MNSSTSAVQVMVKYNEVDGDKSDTINNRQKVKKSKS